MKRLLEETPKKIAKILYVESGVDEKAGAEMLEQSTASLSSAMAVVCAFTVVNNAFIGIECTEHTCYDAVIIQRELKTLGALDMMRVVRNVGAPMPFILLLNPEDQTTNDEALSDGFFCTLRKPYITSTLCAVVRRALETNPSLLPATANSSSALATRGEGRGVEGEHEMRTAIMHAGYCGVIPGSTFSSPSSSSSRIGSSSNSSRAPSDAVRIFRPIPNKRVPPLLHRQSYEMDTSTTTVQSSAVRVRTHAVRDTMQQGDSRVGIRTSRIVGASQQQMTMMMRSYVDDDFAANSSGTLAISHDNNNAVPTTAIFKCVGLDDKFSNQRNCRVRKDAATLASSSRVNTEDTAAVLTTLSTRDTIGTIDTDIMLDAESSTFAQSVSVNWTEMFSEDDLHDFRKFVKQKREYQQWKKQKMEVKQSAVG